MSNPNETEKRLAAALRENLKRRKAQERGRVSAAPQSGDDPASERLQSPNKTP